MKGYLPFFNFHTCHTQKPKYPKTIALSKKVPKTPPFVYKPQTPLGAFINLRPNQIIPKPPAII